MIRFVGSTTGAAHSAHSSTLTIDWIRHTSLQTDGSICYGHTDMQVSPQFEEEAREVLQRLQGKNYDQVYTSPLTRAVKLASFCGYANAILDRRVMELNFGQWENRPWTELMGEKTLDEWFATWHLEMPPEGENLQSLLDRVHDFIEEKRKERLTRIAVFCHGGVINSARYLHGELSLEHIFRLVPPYGSVTTLTYPQD